MSDNELSGPTAVLKFGGDVVADTPRLRAVMAEVSALTCVPGVLKDKDDPTSRIDRLTESEARQAIADGVIVGSMIPKIEEALKNLAQGIAAIHILGAESGALRNEAEHPGSRGTVLLADHT
jgi:acetylglutamate kinase